MCTVMSTSFFNFSHTSRDDERNSSTFTSTMTQKVIRIYSNNKHIESLLSLAPMYDTQTMSAGMIASRSSSPDNSAYPHTKQSFLCQ